MPAAPVRALIDGAAGKIEVAYALPGTPRAVAVVAHPHPLFGGTMENKVVTTVAKAFPAYVELLTLGEMCASAAC